MCRLFDIHYCVSLCSILRMKSRSAFIGSEYSCAPGLRFTCNCVSRAEACEGREIMSQSIVLNNLLSASLAIVSAEGAHSGRRPLRFILPIIIRAFCVGTRRYGVPRNENDESIVCMSVLY